jgi:hypothetical protein
MDYEPDNDLLDLGPRASVIPVTSTALDYNGEKAVGGYFVFLCQNEAVVSSAAI